MGVMYTTTNSRGRTVHTSNACAVCGTPAPPTDNHKLGKYLPECPNCGLLSEATLLPLIALDTSYSVSPGDGYRDVRFLIAKPALPSRRGKLHHVVLALTLASLLIDTLSR